MQGKIRIDLDFEDLSLTINLLVWPLDMEDDTKKIVKASNFLNTKP